MCLRPSIIRDVKYGYYYNVPCGKCVECQRSKSESWKFRLQQESLRRNAHTFFITLTYDNDNLPIWKDTGQGCFSKVDVRNFLLRFREEFYFWFYPKYIQVRDYYKAQNWKGAKAPYLRYFLVGEYGEEFSRPHYHALIFTHKNISPLQLERVIKLAWKKGLIDCQGSNDAAIGYVSKYILKGYYDFDQECDNDNNYTTKLRVRCSHNLGLNFLNSKSTYKRLLNDAIKEETSPVPIFGSNCVTLTSLPRYYRKKLQNENPRLQWSLDKCLRFAHRQYLNEYDKYITMMRHYLATPGNEKQLQNFNYSRREDLIVKHIKKLRNFYNNHGKYEKRGNEEETQSN